MKLTWKIKWKTSTAKVWLAGCFCAGMNYVSYVMHTYAVVVAGAAKHAILDGRASIVRKAHRCLRAALWSRSIGGEAITLNRA